MGYLTSNGHSFYLLTVSILGKKFSRHLSIGNYFSNFSKKIGFGISWFSKKTGFGISCKLSPKNLFSGKDKKKHHQFIVCLSAEFAKRVVKVSLIC